MAVGFADLVGFTSLTREIDEAELATLVEGFESMASDIVASAGARVVKTIGDEVLFVADDVGHGRRDRRCVCPSRCASTIELPDLRVGLAYGTVLSRLGDVYGEPVNLASRLTSIARPGSVLVDREIADSARGDDPLAAAPRAAAAGPGLRVAAPDAAAAGRADASDIGLAA